MSTDLKKITQQLNNEYLNIKAEVVVSHFLEASNLDLNNISILNKGTFTRGFRRDILNSSVNNENNTIEITLVRNGIYDDLPEGIFHKDIKHDEDKSFNQIRSQGKQEEKLARNLFAPLENEFFIQKLLIHQKEKKIITEFSDSDASFLLDIWGIKHKVASKFIFSLTRLLPLANKISQKKALIAKALEEILNEKITIIKKWKALESQKENNSSNSIGSLGVNTTLFTKKTNYTMPFYEITVSLFNSENYFKYIDGEECHQLITVFCEYFIPMEIDWDLKISYLNTEKLFTLGGKSDAVLGIATVI